MEYRVYCCENSQSCQTLVKIPTRSLSTTTPKAHVAVFLMQNFKFKIVLIDWYRMKSRLRVSSQADRRRTRMITLPRQNQVRREIKWPKGRATRTWTSETQKTAAMMSRPRSISTPSQCQPRRTPPVSDAPRQSQVHEKMIEQSSPHKSIINDNDEWVRTSKSFARGTQGRL